MGKTPDTLVGIIHGKRHTIALEIVYFKFLFCSVFAFKLYSQFSFTFCHKVCCTVLIAKSMTSNAYWSRPVWNQAGNIAHHDGLAKNSTVKNVPDCAIG